VPEKASQCVGLHGPPRRCIGLSRATAGYGRCRLPGALGAEHLRLPCTHAFFRCGPRRQTWPAVTQRCFDLRLQIRTPRTDHHETTASFGFVRTPGHHQLACSRQTLPDHLRPGAGAGRDCRSARVAPQRPAICRGDALLSSRWTTADLYAAIHQPRIDASEGALVIVDVLPAPTAKRLSGRASIYEEGAQGRPFRLSSPARACCARCDLQRRRLAIPAVGRSGGGRLTTTLEQVTYLRIVIPLSFGCLKHSLSEKPVFTTFP